MAHDDEGIGPLQVKHTMIPLVEDGRQHLIDNTDPQALTEERLRFVYDDITDQEIQDFVAVFYGEKKGQLTRTINDLGQTIHRASLT